MSKKLTTKSSPLLPPGVETSEGKVETGEELEEEVEAADEENVQKNKFLLTLATWC